MYIKLVRPKFASENNPYVFSPFRGAVEYQMSHTMVSRCLTSSFSKSNALTHGTFHDESVSCSRLHTSIATILLCSKDVDIDTLASSFMKHKSKTCQQYYVVRYARLEAARISRKCYDKFHLVEECETITRQVINKPAPTKLQLDEWYTENF